MDMIDSRPLPDTLVAPTDGAEMVLVPAGEFTMGMDQDDLNQIFMLDDRENPVYATEAPARKVHLESYYIDRYPVTNYQYRKFIESTGHREPMLLNHPDWGQPMQPVVFVGWDDARAYANWAGKVLPTEEYWEKAGRGTDSRWWAWGQEFLPDRCNPENSDCSKHRKSACLIRASAPMDAMTCAAMFGKCAKANGLKAPCRCGGVVFWARQLLSE